MKLFNFAIWAGILAVTSYGMGTLYERKQAMTNDIRDSFGGLLVVLQQFIETKNTARARQARLASCHPDWRSVRPQSDRIELMRSAILLRDLSKLGISNDMLYKAADTNRDEIVALFGRAAGRGLEAGQLTGYARAARRGADRRDRRLRIPGRH